MVGYKLIFICKNKLSKMLFPHKNADPGDKINITTLALKGTVVWDFFAPVFFSTKQLLLFGETAPTSDSRLPGVLYTGESRLPDPRKTGDS